MTYHRRTFVIHRRLLSKASQTLPRPTANGLAYGISRTRFWASAKDRRLSPAAPETALYCLASPHTNDIDRFPLPDALIAKEIVTKSEPSIWYRLRKQAKLPMCLDQLKAAPTSSHPLGCRALAGQSMISNAWARTNGEKTTPISRALR